MTQLTGREKPIHFEQHPALPRDFAFQQIQQLTHCRIRERAREAAIADQSLDMQILYRDNPTGRGDLRGQLVQPIEPDARDLIMSASQLVFRLEPVFPALVRRASSLFNRRSFFN